MVRTDTRWRARRRQQHGSRCDRLNPACDLVHVHGNGFIIEIGQFLAELYHKPYVITLYGTDVWHYDSVRHVRFGHVVRGAACRVFYSHALLDFAVPLRLASDPSMVIYAPVPATFRSVDHDARLALRRDLGAGGGPLLLTVKRLHDVAGYDVLLNALPFVLGQHPDASLWIVGDGDLRPALEAQAHDLGLTSKIRFLGRIDNEALWRYYAAADLFVLPSRLESWGTVMLEALASGTQVVATDTAGGVEVHQHFPDDVMLAAKENPEELAAAVCRAIGKRQRAGEATRTRLRTEFSVSGCAARYLDVYRLATHAS